MAGENDEFPNAYRDMLNEAWFDCFAAGRALRTYIASSVRVEPPKKSDLHPEAVCGPQIINYASPMSEDARILLGSFIGALSQVFKEVELKVRGCGDKELIARFDSFSACVDDPKEFYQDFNKAYALEACLREVRDKLKLAELDKGV